jgi:S-DNA-T family DNA segregation ATPase FtsK/SpoIIIE
VSINDKIFFYILILITTILFLISINFNPKNFFKVIEQIFTLFNKKGNKNYTDKSEIINEYIPQDEIKNLIQEDLPFIKSESKSEEKIKFQLPDLKLLEIPTKKEREIFEKNEAHDPEFLEKILMDFGVSGNIKKVSHGPVVTLNEFEPAAGVKVSKIINLSDDIARNTSSESARIATIPGSNTVGIELPNNIRENVYLSEILSNADFKKKDIKLPIALGKNISGKPIVGDLASMPHLLIAGTTGSGKSVCINTIILSLLYRHTPNKCKFILIDPKMLELSTYEGIPHLLCPVITEAKKAASVLGWVVKEMESRYRLMTKEGVRNIDGYNTKHKLPMPYIVVVVDEMSDLMLVAGKEIENYIQKLSQMARAAGIHIIMATQRPSVDVITGTIKANFPTRISFQVTSKIDSRTILGEQGAEQLLGRGDMLYMSSANRIVRIHAPFVSDNEIEKINNSLRTQAEPDYIDEILNFADEKEIGDNQSQGDKDELYSQALEIIRSEGKASTSFLQRKLQIGYNRAARIIDMMEADGIVSKANHVGKRDVL